MKITVIAATQVVDVPDSMAATAIGQDMVDAYDFADDSIDTLHEFAGRACYKSWNKPNPATRDNEDYLAHIIESQHESVLEHGSVSLYVEGVSRSLLLELERHRHLSFSVESQRYVSTSKHHPEPVIPPLFGQVFSDIGVVATENLIRHYEASLRLYDRTYADLREAGASVKQAREAARAFLPNATPVDFVVTGNLRAWRYVIAKRDADGADAEIRQFAQAVDEALREFAPNSMQDAA